MRVSTVAAPGATIHVRSSGFGPPLVLLPGLGRPASDLDPLAAHLVQAGYAAVQPDPRGSGGSHGTLEGLTLHDLAADVAAVVAAAGGAPVTVIGQGFGNRVARTLAADRPDLAGTVVLLGCSGKVQPAPEVAEAIRLAQAPGTPDGIRAHAVRLAWFAPERDISVWMDGWSQPVMKAYLAAAAATDVAAWWTAGQARVLILQGQLDVAAPLENGRQLKAEIGERADLVELPGIGHAIGVEAPGAVADAILAYLSKGEVSLVR